MIGTFPEGLAPSAPADTEESCVRPETVLLVEDEPAVRRLFFMSLTRAGYRVIEATNGQEAIRTFDEQGDAIDMVLTDMRMPFMGGAQLLKELRSRRSTLKMLCISGFAGATELEFDGDFLVKPFSREDLLRKVREILDRS